MGWGKRIKGMAEVGAGVALEAGTGGAATPLAVPLTAKGATDIAGSFGSGSSPTGSSVPASTRQIGAASPPPFSAASLEESRGQGRARMKSIYKYP